MLCTLNLLWILRTVRNWSGCLECQFKNQICTLIWLKQLSKCSKSWKYQKFDEFFVKRGFKRKKLLFRKYFNSLLNALWTWKKIGLNGSGLKQSHCYKSVSKSSQQHILACTFQNIESLSNKVIYTCLQIHF